MKPIYLHIRACTGGSDMSGGIHTVQAESTESFVESIDRLDVPEPIRIHWCSYRDTHNPGSSISLTSQKYNATGYPTVIQQELSNPV